ncbi:MAG: AsmA family protein [Limnobacter sp.]|nr:AsmA family protein [Limnobacter sp.]
MKKWIAWSLAGVVGVPLVLGATAAILVNTLDQQALLNKTSVLMHNKYQRKLVFNGPVDLKWFPSIGADLSQVSLSEPRSEDAFLTADKVSVSLALWPLLHSEVVVDAIKAKGVSVKVIKNAEGTYNFNDFLNPVPVHGAEPETGSGRGKPLDFSVSALDLSDIDLRYHDVQQDLEASLTGFSLLTGRIQPGVPTHIALRGKVTSSKPQADLDVQLETALEFGLGNNVYASLDDLKLAVMGLLNGQKANVSVSANALKLGQTAAQGGRLAVQFSLDQPQGRVLGGNLALSELAGNLQEALAAQLVADVSLKNANRTAALELKSPVRAHLQNQTLELPGFAGSLKVTDPALPKVSTTVPVTGKLLVNNKAQLVNAQLSSSYEGTAFDVKAELTNFAKPFVDVALHADTLNVDALFHPSKAGNQAAGAGEGSASGSAKGSSASAKTASLDNTPIDLSPLQAISGNFSLKVGSVQYSGVHARNLNAQAVAKNGRLTVSPLSANLYEGSTKGTLVADSNTRQFAIKQVFSDVQVAPLLHDLLDKNMVSGKGDVNLDLTARGNTVGDLKRSLDGRVSVALNNGAIKGFNLAQSLRND